MESGRRKDGEQGGGGMGRGRKGDSGGGKEGGVGGGGTRGREGVRGQGGGEGTGTLLQCNPPRIILFLFTSNSSSLPLHSSS